MTGHLTLIIGPMFAGKSTELIKRIRQEEKANESVKVLSINHSIDSRYGPSTNITTHDLVSYPVSITTSKLLSIADSKIEAVDFIIIDELQFFTDAFPALVYWTDVLKKRVVAAGLDGDSNRKPFGDVLRLIPFCDEVIKKTSICSRCLTITDAPFTLRKTNPYGKTQICVGVGEYEPVCREHFVSATTGETFSQSTLYANAPTQS